MKIFEEMAKVVIYIIPLKTGYAETAQLLMPTQEDREQIEAIFGDISFFKEPPKRRYQKRQLTNVPSIT